jgi:predicted nucleotidyltransferase
LASSLSTFLKNVSYWAETQPNIHEVFLVGSQARGEAKADSDVDLVILCKDPKPYLENLEWIGEFGKLKRKTVEDWGRVTSVRVWYKSGLEVEFGFTDLDWAKEPLDEGTKRVLREASYQLLFERT